MSDNSKIHVAIAFDQNFTIPFFVLLTSIFSNNKNNSLFFHVIASGIGEKEKEQISNYVRENNGEINFLAIDTTTVDDLTLPKNVHFSSATYYRLYFPSLISSEISKLIYLDTDIVVIGDLKKLYDINFDPYPVAAVKDAADVGIRHDLGINSKEGYFNAGVLLIDLVKWRSQKISEKALTYIRSYPENIKWADQDGLNATLISNWFELDIKYNLSFYDIPGNLRKSHFKTFLRNKTIVHYTTEQKPWYMTCRNRFRFLYHDFLERTPYVTKTKYTDWRWENFFNFLKIRIKEFLIDRGINFVLKKKI